MSTIKLVTPDFKVKQSRKGITERKLLDEIEELKERLEEETKRADELFDQLEKFERNNHEDYEVIERYEYQDIKRDLDLLEDFNSLIDEVRITKDRANLGIAGQFEELEQLIEKVLEANL